MKSSKKKTDPSGVRKDYPLIRTCANCAHFVVLDEGYEIGRIEDTRFMTSRCEVLGWRVKEHYNFASSREVLEIKPKKDCPFWKYFDEKSVGERKP